MRAVGFGGGGGGGGHRGRTGRRELNSRLCTGLPPTKCVCESGQTVYPPFSDARAVRKCNPQYCACPDGSIKKPGGRAGRRNGGRGNRRG